MGKHEYAVLFLDVGRGVPDEIAQEAAATLSEFLHAVAQEGFYPVAVPQQFAVAYRFTPDPGEEGGPPAPSAPRPRRRGRPRKVKEGQDESVSAVPASDESVGAGGVETEG